MSEPYLILHKVRGLPAFDIAERLEVETPSGGFEEWWIIPTSGHRAYPYFILSLMSVSWGHDYAELAYNNFPWKDIGDLPSVYPNDIPDHYPTTTSPFAPSPSSLSLAQRLGLVPKAAVITRRL